MKNIIALLFVLLISSGGFAQTLTELVNDSLTIEQSKMLNTRFESERGEREFQNLKVAFFSSPGGAVQQTSSHFFEYPQETYETVYFFNQKDVEKHGYDCMIVYGSKYAPIKGNNKRLKKLRKKTK